MLRGGSRHFLFQEGQNPFELCPSAGESEIQKHTPQHQFRPTPSPGSGTGILQTSRTPACARQSHNRQVGWDLLQQHTTGRQISALDLLFQAPVPCSRQPARLLLGLEAAWPLTAFPASAAPWKDVQFPPRYPHCIDIGFGKYFFFFFFLLQAKQLFSHTCPFK